MPNQGTGTGTGSTTQSLDAVAWSCPRSGSYRLRTVRPSGQRARSSASQGIDLDKVRIDVVVERDVHEPVRMARAVAWSYEGRGDQCAVREAGLGVVSGWKRSK